MPSTDATLTKHGLLRVYAPHRRRANCCLNAEADGKSRGKVRKGNARVCVCVSVLQSNCPVTKLAFCVSLTECMQRSKHPGYKTDVFDVNEKE